MQHFYRFIIVPFLLFSPAAHALEFFADALYWRATESLDWALTNNQNTTDLSVTYKTVTFDFEPAFRVGVNYEGNWDTKFYYTRYYTNTKGSTQGHLTSAFSAGKISQPAGVFYFQSGQIHVTINYNMLDLDIGKRFYFINEALMLRPLLGVKGGWINQTIDNSFQGSPSIVEKLKNDFTGIGPKAGIETKLRLLRFNDSQVNLIADFSTAYLWGSWTIDDLLTSDIGTAFEIGVKDRSFASLEFQALVGANIDYENFSMTLGYEINDWLNQCQVFTDGTGTQTNDLILQGITLHFAYDF